MKICFAIPARLDSVRIPRKMLLDINGKPLVRHDFDQVNSWGHPTLVLTDSDEIYDVIPKGNAIMTETSENGTARIANADLNWWSYDYVINIQGDMIDIKQHVIRKLYDRITERKAWTFYTPVRSGLGDVKVIHDLGVAKWFTRAPIGYGDRHLGIYAYTPQVLEQYKIMTDKYPQENLEQNRILSYQNMGVIKTQYNGIEINTQEDIDRWQLQHRK